MGMHRETGLGERPLVRVELDPAIVQPLRKEAAHRDTTLQRLIADLLDAIATDGLVTAVLDDEQS
jgi:hypothetical protein